jgi:hypothetical protein
LHTGLLSLADAKAAPVGSFGGSYANRRRLRGGVSLSHAIASLEAGKSPVVADYPTAAATSPAAH